MLCISRRRGEKLILTLGETRIEIAFGSLNKGNIRVGITAPQEVKVLRAELEERERQGKEPVQ